MMSAHPVVERDAWLASRKALLEKEKAFLKARDQLSRERQALPWVRIEQPYVFAHADGDITLAELFEDKSQLIVCHFMLGPDWNEGCPSCSFWADFYDPAVVHLAARDVAFAAVSRSSMERIEAYRKRMGWSFTWVSSLANSFNQDFGVSFSAQDVANGQVDYNYAQRPAHGEEAPGLSVFSKNAAGEIFHTYSCYARGLDMMNSAYQLLDLVPKGRDEGDLPFTMAWVRRHDQYEARTTTE